MNSEDMFDILLQFDQQVIKDIQVRALNTSASTNLWISGPFSRIVEQRVPPLEMKACWNKPNVEMSDDDNDDLIELSAEVNGGARQAITGHILTVEGEVSIKLPITFDVDTNGRPYACLESPKLFDLHMNKLKVTYEGSKWPEFLAKFDPAKEETSLRPVLTTQLIGPLASIPLTYMPLSLPVVMPLQAGVSNGTLPIVQAQAQVIKDPNSVVLGLMLNQTRRKPSLFSTILPDQTKYNAALSISTEGMNAFLSYLCTQGRAKGTIIHSQWGLISWQWETLTVTFSQHGIHVAGMFRQQGSTLAVHAQVRCLLDKDGCLQSTLLSINTDMATAETLLASWSTLLKILLRLRAADKQDRNPHDRERLYQCFNLPTTPETIETMARELVVENGRLIVYYIIPKTIKGFQVAVPPPKPTVMISQPDVPQQIAQGAPVTAQVKASIIKASSPPYDYVWKIDPSPEPRPEHEPEITLTVTPHQPVTGPGPQKLTDVHLKVIDIFGQVADAQAPAIYQPYPQHNLEQEIRVPDVYPLLLPPKPEKKKNWKKGLTLVFALFVLLFATVSVLVIQHLWARPAPPVIKTLTPQPTATVQLTQLPTAPLLSFPTPQITPKGLQPTLQPTQPPPAQLSLTPGSLTIDKDCHLAERHLVFWACSIQLANQGGQTTYWQAQNDMSSIYVDPADPSEGDLAPGQSQSLMIQVVDQFCSNPTLTFTSSSGDSATLFTACPLPPAQLVVTPNSLDLNSGDSHCSSITGPPAYWLCNVQLDNQGGQTTHWQIQSEPSSPISVDPAYSSEGDLAAGSTQDLEIRVANNCSSAQTLPFASSSGPPASLSINCPQLIM